MLYALVFLLDKAPPAFDGFLLRGLLHCDRQCGRYVPGAVERRARWWTEDLWLYRWRRLARFAFAARRGGYRRLYAGDAFGAAYMRVIHVIGRVVVRR